MQNILNKNLILFVFLVLLFRVLLEISYVNVVSQIFAYEGYQLNFSYLNYVTSWVVFLSGFYLVRDRIYKVSDYFFITAFLAVIIPLSVLFGYDSERSFFPFFILLMAIFFINLVTRTKIISFKTLPTFKDGIRFVVVISAIFVAFLVVWYFVSGVSFNLNFSKVYDFRGENADLAAGGLLSYTNNWTYKIFNMVLFAIALRYRRYFLAIIIFGVQVYFYAASAHKSILFLPILIIGVWFYFRKTNSLAVVPFLFSSVIAFTLITYYLLGDILASSLFSRRVFFVPANLTYVYFDFFHSNPKVLWSNSVLSSFLTYPYDLSMAYVVGSYLGKEGMGANNGFVASGYAHAGLFGVFFYALIIGLILRFINDVTYYYIPLWFAVALSIVPLRSLLISSDLFTVMLTHGFIVALVVIFLARSKKYAQFK